MGRTLCLMLGMLLLSQAQAGGSGGSNICGSLPKMDITGIRKRLAAAEALWARRGPHHYALTTQFSGIWMRFEAEIHVADQITGEIITDQLALAGPGPIPPPLVSRARPEEAQRYAVPGLFKQVQWLLGQYRPLPAVISHPVRPVHLVPFLDSDLHPCGTLKTSFDPADGHVRSLEYDGPAIDDEFSLTTLPVIPFN